MAARKPRPHLVGAVDQAEVNLRERCRSAPPPYDSTTSISLYPSADAYGSSCHRTQCTERTEHRIDGQLISDLPIRSRKEAIEKLNWYAMR